MGRERHGKIIFVLMVICLVFIDEIKGGKTHTSSQIRRHLKGLNKPALRSIKSEDGDIIDCIDIYKQPAFDHPLLKNHTIQMRPSNYNSEKISPLKPLEQLWHQSGSCREGTVPIRRTGKADLLRAGSLTYGMKAHSYQKESARMRLTGINHGAAAYIGVWNIYVAPDETSISSIFVARQGKLDLLNSGWIVSSKIYGDNLTRLYGFWGSESGGCFDMMCPGFVQTNNQIALGAVLTPLSVYNGPQRFIHVKIHKNGRAEEALEVFDRMRDAGVEVDSATVVSVLPACAQVKDLRRGREIHQLVDEKGFGSRMAVRNSLVDMYAKCGAFEDARNEFEEMGERDVVSWTALIGGFVLNGYAVEALRLSHQMQLLGMRPNSVTLAGLLSACASLSSLKHGKCIHGSAVRHGFESGVVVKTALIDMYAKCGCVDLGYQLVLMGDRRRAAPWNALISGHTWNEQAGEAIVLFKQMKLEEVHPDGATMICLLPAYAKLADLQQAMNIHCYLIRTGFQKSAEITTGLIDVYSKSGNLDSARDLFDRLHEKDIVSWSAIIAGYGMHGHGRDAIFLFNWMLQSGVKPNLITYTSILRNQGRKNPYELPNKETSQRSQQACTQKHLE
ncbi:hypothetical protein AAC387_Pa02g2744 [Persea americana]